MTLKVSTCYCDKTVRDKAKVAINH